MNRVVHFEIPADDPQRVMDFYGSVFGWTYQQFGEESYWLVLTGEGAGIDGGIMAKKHPEQPPVNTIEVGDLDAWCSKVEAAGGQIVVPKMPIPGVGYLAYFKDPEGNIVGMMQSDPTAS